jgi:hypothetical protein
MIRRQPRVLLRPWSPPLLMHKVSMQMWAALRVGILAGEAMLAVGISAVNGDVLTRLPRHLDAVSHRSETALPDPLRA